MTYKKKTPSGIDDKVYKGVLVGLQAMRARHESTVLDNIKTVILDVNRRDQRLFSIPDMLDSDQARCSVVALNGVECVYGRDFKISDNVLNWLSDRKLYKSDAIAIRYSADSIPTPTIGKRMNRKNTKFVIADHSSALSGMKVALASVEEKLTYKISELAKKQAELEAVVDTIDSDLSILDTRFENSIEESVTEASFSVSTQTLAQEEEMVETGRKVWHRLTGEGPWIAVQQVVLSIESSQEEGGISNLHKKSYVENAWTVQTDEGVKDFPEVVLTTVKPKKAGTSWFKKILLGTTVIATTAIIVHAPAVLSLLGVF